MPRTKRVPEQAVQIESKARNLYGRVYLFAHPDKYSARIWNQKGADIWHAISDSPEQAYAAMREAASKMDEPVDLYRHGVAEIAETTGGKELPF